MAYSTMDARRETVSPGARSVFWLILICGAAVALILALAMVLLTDDRTAETAVGPEDTVMQAPTGAGTNPDGAADEAVEGLRNQTATDDFLDAGAAATPLTANDGPEPATSAEGLSPAGGGEVMLPPQSGEEATVGDAADVPATEFRGEAPNPALRDGNAGTTLVDDPNDGQPNEPDGGAGEFYPVPSGPEGRDGNPLTPG